MKSKFLSSYASQVADSVASLFPDMTREEVVAEVLGIAASSHTDEEAVFSNDYTREERPIGLLQFADWCLGKHKPILSSFGAAYQPHDQAPNLIAVMLQSLLDTRKVAKKKMLEHVNDTDRTAHDNWDRIQKVVKILNNSYYGASGERNSYFYNPRIGPSVTYTGVTIITTSLMSFEQFFAGNAPFNDLSEVMLFVSRCRKLPQNEVALRDGSHELELEARGVAVHLAHRIRDPKPGDVKFLTDYLDSSCDQEELQMIFYRNNLFKFLELEWVSNMVQAIVDSGEDVDPDHPSEEVRPLLEDFWEKLKEYVFYPWVPEDKKWRAENDVRKVVIVSDTDLPEHPPVVGVRRAVLRP
jgi:hypothetical protein